MDNDIVITRVLDAPRSDVFKAWTDPERMKHWWGPNGFTMPYCKIDRIPFRTRDGNVVAPSTYGMNPDWPAEALITVTFAEHDGTTKFTLRHAVGSAPAADREGCQVGWSESLDRLAGSLKEA